MTSRTTGWLAYCAAALLLGLGIATPGVACTYVRPSDAELSRQKTAVAVAKAKSSVVVRGRWRPDATKGGLYASSGTIFPTRLIRGKKLPVYKAHKAFPTDPCRNEDVSLAHNKSATFYLAARRDGTFAILHFDAQF